MKENAQTDGNLALQNRQYRVITIEPTKAPQNARLRVAAYARVSSSSNDQLNSFGAQNRYYTDLIAREESWVLVDIYADEGITGTSVEKRDDFQRLLSDCRRRLIDRVLVKSISRFARNTKECLEVLRELKLLGISVQFEKENIDTAVMSGEMMTAMYASLAQAESESISGNMRWSIEARMRDGSFIPSHQPYGYRLVDHKIAIDVPRAKVVCEIFDWYLSGQNTKEIAELLNRMQTEYPEPGNRVWTYKAVTRILKNEKYTGDSLWQKTYRTDTLPTKELPNRGEQPQYYAYNTHPAIIAKTVFESVQELIAVRGKFHRTTRHNGQSPFQAITVCAHCGQYLRGKNINGTAYRVCRTHDTDSTACSLLPIPEEVLCKVFLRLYFNLKHHGSTILGEMASSLQTIRSRRMLWNEDVIGLNKKISDLSSQNQMLAQLMQQGLIDPDIFIYQSNELSQQLREAKLKKERLLAQNSDCTLEQTQELLGLLEDGPDILETFDTELFHELVDKIVVESSTHIRFRLKNGLELPETIERTVR